MFTQAELEHTNEQMHARFLSVSDQILRALSQLERLISATPLDAQISGLAAAAQIASTQQQLRTQVERLPSSPLQRSERLRSALDAQQGVLRQLSIIVEQHAPVQRHEITPGANVAPVAWMASELCRTQGVPHGPTPTEQAQIPRVTKSAAPSAQQLGVRVRAFLDHLSADRVRERYARPAWSRRARRSRVGSHSGAKNASGHRLLAIARKQIYPAINGVGARTLGLLAMVVAGAVASYGMFPYASEQPNAAVKPTEIVTARPGAAAASAGAPPVERSATVDLASPATPPLAAARPQTAQEGPTVASRLPLPPLFSAAAESEPSPSPPDLANRADRPVPGQVAAFEPASASATKSAPPPASARAGKPATKPDPAIAALASAAVASDADVLQRFGMLGRIAVDCAAPHSRSNPHQIYAVSSSGNVTRTLKMDNPKLDATLSLRNVRMLTPDLLQFEETGRASALTISIVNIDGKFRNWHSAQADGTVLIANGKFAGSGKPTVAFKFCGN